MKQQITVTVNGHPVAATVGQTLAEIIGMETPCGGHGKCGKCHIVAHGALSEPEQTELELLSDEQRAQGIRLACLTRALGNCAVETDTASGAAEIMIDGVLPAGRVQPDFTRYGVAVDIGTTTLAAALYDHTGKRRGGATRLNPQAQWGADVVSRIEAALAGQDGALADAIRRAINEMLRELPVHSEEVQAVVITGNTVMLSLLTGQTVEPFSHAPFDVKELFGQTLSAADLSLSALSADTPVYLPPCISAFVGADITCAVLATGLCEQDGAMLVDIGTNGEMALWREGRLTVCSTAAGPAFEGVGISMGMRGAEGAIDRVELQNGRLCAHVIGDTTARGICGSGLVDAVAGMLACDVVDESGYLEDDPFVVADSVTVTGKDIRMLQLAKSAICAGLQTLMTHCALPESHLAELYIAGGFGSYLNTANAVRIGLLPRAVKDVCTTVGNAALSGAAMLLLDPALRETAARLAAQAQTVELSTHPVFTDRYISAMMFDEI